MATSELIIHKTKQKFRLVILGKNMKNHDFDNNDDYIYKYRIVNLKCHMNRVKYLNLSVKI